MSYNPETDGKLDTTGKTPEVMMVFTHISKGERLFPKPSPTITDIDQRTLGDCGLLATLMAIVNYPKGREYIQKIMRDNRDGTVTVRLYDAGGQPHYLVLKKSIIYTLIPVLKHHGAGALWVAILEKALTAFEVRKVGANNVLLYDPAGASYNRLKARSSQFTMNCILGGNPDTTPISKFVHKSEDFGNIIWCLFSGADRINDQGICTYPAGQPQPTYNILNLVFKGNRQNLQSWKIYFRNNNLKQKWDNYKFTSKSIGIVMRWEDLDRFLHQQFHLDDKAKYAVLDWAGKELPGKRGTGLYTTKQEQYFNTIATKNITKHPTTVSSTESVGSKSKGLNLFHSGETFSKGLVGEHMYAVLDTKKENYLMYIKLGNPWGSNKGITKAFQKFGLPAPGRIYEKKQGLLKAKGTHEAQFWLELSDLTKRFDIITSGTIPNG